MPIQLLGLLIAIGVAGPAGNFLVGIGPTDPLTYAVASVLLVAVAMLASDVPVHRAMNGDPSAALRHE